jgi:DNA repair protein RecN (Recombination protein N)
MIKSLYISNFGIIDRAELLPCRGFNVLTGETGAGKSMIVSAMNLVFGKRQSLSSNLWSDRKTIVEMTVEITSQDLYKKLIPLFELAETDFETLDKLPFEVIIRREITSSGRSRAFINDTPVSLSVMRDFAALVVDISEQHQTLSVYHKTKRLQLVDDYAGNGEQMAAYSGAFATERKLLSELNSKKEELRRLEEEQDYYRFQLEELDKLGYVEGDEESLEQERELLANAEEIKKSLFEAFQVISADEYGAANAVDEAVRKLRPAALHHKPAGDLLNSLVEISGLLSDISKDLENEYDGIEYSRDRLNEVEERLSEIYRLVKKHRLENGDGLPAVADDYRNKLSSFDNLGDDIRNLEKEYEKAKVKLEMAAKELTLSRESVVAEMGEKATGLLKSMAIPSAKVEFRLSPSGEYTETGVDDVDIFFTANKGVEPQPVEEVASGGELSRLMLALKSLIGAKKQMPVLIFDEIDTGISGETAVRVGEMMKKLSGNTQLITISHLPQIAARADCHFEIFKEETGDKTISGIRRLDDEQRVEILAAMLSGKKDSAKARSTAKEMLNG